MNHEQTRSRGIAAMPERRINLMTAKQRRELAAMLREVADDPRVPKRDRERAAERADELEQYRSRPSDARSHEGRAGRRPARQKPCKGV